MLHVYWSRQPRVFRHLPTLLLTLSGRVTHICVGNLTIIGSDNGLSPGQRQAIIRTNAGVVLIGPLGRNFNEILIEICTFSFKEMHLKMSSGKWRPSCLGLNVLRTNSYFSSTIETTKFLSSLFSDTWCELKGYHNPTRCSSCKGVLDCNTINSLAPERFQ